MAGMTFALLAAAVIAAGAGCAHNRREVTALRSESPSPDTIADASRSPRRAATNKANAPANPGDTTTVNKYLSYDAVARTVDIKLVAAATGALGGLNFNGGTNGDQTITVPAGWAVDIDFLNEDAIPHSAIVIEDQKPIPASPSKAAFPRAYTAHLADGLSPQTGHDTMHFVANQAGHYLIACGVPGHAVGGMYITFVVSPTASAPTNTGTIGPP